MANRERQAAAAQTDSRSPAQVCLCHCVFLLCNRWNSVYDCLDRAIELEDCMRYVCEPNDDYRPYLPDDGDWAIARDLLKFLQPFKIATQAFSATSMPTASCAFPIFSRLKKVMGEQMKAYAPDAPLWDLANRLFTNLKAEIDAMDPFLKRAAFFDPRFFGFVRKEMDSKERDTLVNQLQAEFARWEAVAAKEKAAGSGEAKAEPANAMAVDSEGKTAAPDLDAVMLGEGDGLPPAPEAPKGEFMKYYLTEPGIAHNANPLHHWRDTLEAKYPVLADKMARRYLSVVTGSVASERLFSTAGDIVDSLRTRLNVNSAEVLVYLHQNLPALRKLKAAKAAAAKLKAAKEEAEKAKKA